MVSRSATRAGAEDQGSQEAAIDQGGVSEMMVVNRPRESSAEAIDHQLAARAAGSGGQQLYRVGVQDKRPTLTFRVPSRLALAPPPIADEEVHVLREPARTSHGALLAWGSSSE